MTKDNKEDRNNKNDKKNKVDDDNIENVGLCVTCLGHGIVD